MAVLDLPSSKGAEVAGQCGNDSIFTPADVSFRLPGNRLVLFIR